MVGEIEGSPAPRALTERKQWERGMLALALSEAGGLDGESSVLAIGAGSEPVVFRLANRAGMVTATDIYGEGKFAALEAAESMLRKPFCVLARRLSEGSPRCPAHGRTPVGISE